MEQFSLEKYLENTSRKVVTRDGRVVKILDTEFESGNGNKSVLAKCIYNNKAAVYVYTTDGKANNIGETENDLFFVDEEEKLTEFEKELKAMIQDVENDDFTNESFDFWKNRLLDLARKEVKKDIYDNGYRMGYGIGKQDALKDLPKWKKMPNGIQGNGWFNPTYLVKVSNGYCFTTPCLSWDKDSMYIELSDLEKLPKEE